MNTPDISAHQVNTQSSIHVTAMRECPCFTRSREREVDSEDNNSHLHSRESRIESQTGNR
jgi:hypothetical protein